MYSILFHKDVFMPEGASEVATKLNQLMTGYFLSNHFEEHLENQDIEDRSHTYFRNAVLNCLNEMCSEQRRMLIPFEIELSKDYHFFGKSGWFVTKYCVRIPYNLKSDLVVVIRPQWDRENQKYDLSKNMIVTAWINHKDDSHFTLDNSKYVDKEKWLSINNK